MKPLLGDGVTPEGLSGVQEGPTAREVPVGPQRASEPLCLLDESNDMEAFAALPDCEACGGTGKDVPAGFWAEGGTDG
jgi:hypothetical protein